MEPVRINSNIAANYTDDTAQTSHSHNYSPSLAQSEGDVFVSKTQKPRQSFFGRIINAFSSLVTRGRSSNAAQVQEQASVPSQTYELAVINQPQEPHFVPIQEQLDEVLSTPVQEQSDEKPKTEMGRFLESSDYDKKIKAATQGKYQNSLLKILSSKTLDDDTKRELEQCGLTEEEFLRAVKKLSTSTFKAALNKPSQYINYTQDPMFQTFTVDCFCDGIRFPDDEAQAGAYMEYFLGKNIAKLVKALQYIDTDTLNQMMDKRSTGFRVMLDSIDRLTPENGKLLKELIGFVREGDAKQKIKLCQLVEIFQSNDFDMDAIKDLGKNGEIDTEKINKIFEKAVLNKAGIEQADEKTNTNFNEEYFHLLFSRMPTRMSGAPACEYHLNNLVKEAAKGNFEEYINDESNIYGKANKNTKNSFKENGLDYEQWVHPDFEQSDFDMGGKKMSLKMWERNPHEDIFLGNKTRCCTAIATGSNSAAMPLYLMNTSFNVVEMTDNKGNVKGMARIYMSKANDKPCVVIDSVELADIKQMDDKDKLAAAKNIFKYVEKFGETITKSPVDVYYVAEDTKLPIDKDYKADFMRTEFLGDISSDKIYTNSNSNGHWGDLRGFTGALYYKVA